MASHEMCVCTHTNLDHDCIDDGTVVGQWGSGGCQRCGCRRFNCEECYPKSKLEAQLKEALEMAEFYAKPDAFIGVVWDNDMGRRARDFLAKHKKGGE